MTTKELLVRLTAAPSVSGAENAAAGVIADALAGTADLFETDPLCNLKATLNPDAPAEDGLLLLAHMDKIGFIVTGVDEATGFLRIEKCGGSDLRCAPAMRVKVLGKRALPGVIISTPPHLATPDAANKALPVDKLGVDCGLPYEDMKDLVVPGDRVMEDYPLYELGETKVCGPYLDDCAGVAAVIRAAGIYKEKGGTRRLECVFTTREEVGGQGAETASFTSGCGAAIAVDVSFAKAPGVPETVEAALGSGPMIGCAPVLHKDISDRLKALAEEKNIPYTVEVMGRSTGTDADDALTAGGGKKTGLISIPLRNMHTPDETADVRDIEAAASLLAAFALCEKEDDR
ncbi:MAG: M20/M25/M40 family metallo-hydrolase [Clostridia bacterium]|nr:M20/M25/M40 family metallo-hydrolase [Clostridia bacterium]